MSNNNETRCDGDHLGHFLYNYMRKIPNEICQIDAATGQQETCGSVLSRCIQLSQCFGKLGLVPGDPIAVGGRNHLDVHIPYYAAMMTGLPVAGVDPSLKKTELMNILQIVKPKLAFCEDTMLEEYEQAVQELGLNTKMITFGGGFSLQTLLASYQDLLPEGEFQVATFNTDVVYCWLCSTSGTTGTPKVVALTHSHLKKTASFYKLDKAKNGVRKTAMNLSTLNWISGCFNALMMPLHHVKVQTSAPVTAKQVVDIINRYKPAATICTPTLLASLLHHEACDLTCFDIIKIGGSKVHSEFLLSLRARVGKHTIIYQAYGQTEVGILLQTTSDKPLGHVEKNDPNYETKIIDPKTEKEITEPMVTGELLVRGTTMACYYNDPVATEEAYTKDGYYKTGDLFYRDENGLFYFVERLKMLLKYRNYQVIPPDVEEVILMHEEVQDVCVTGIPHLEDGEHVVACIVRRPGSTVTAQEIKDLVAKHLSASKHLHGGVVFLDALPITSSGKVARTDVKKLVLTAYRE